MCAVAILNGAEKDKGSIIPSLVIAALSLISNSFFFVRYTILYRSGGNVILKTQSRLYRAKCLVDGCVSVVLTVLMVSPHSMLAHGMDMIGSFAVAVYLAFCGIRTIRESFIESCEVDE
jgi:divalent metal cation (Fe/Co/Zn/Cd) transporter